MKHVAIIGSKGMVGSDLVQYLQTAFRVTSIDKSNYDSYKGCSFDIIINANGNSRRYWANAHPVEDFLASTASVYKSIFDFSCTTYVYISSPDVYEDHTRSRYTREDQTINSKSLTPYGYHKYLSELIVRKYQKKHLILRCSMILGTNIKKGPFYDVVHGNALFISPGSRLQLITTRAVSEVIKILLEKNLTRGTLNVGGVGTFAFTKIKDYYHKKIQVSPEAETQVYEMNVTKLRRIYPKLATSQDYLRDFLRVTSGM